ncbi:hypothetical protein ACFL35_16860, partial [Candidatus Riflebacteria bacterium]
MDRWEEQKVKTRIRNYFIAILLFILPIFVIPSYWCGREVDVFWARKGQVLKPFARAVNALIKKGTPSQSIKTGHWQYDGEWQFGSYQMAGLG